MEENSEIKIIHLHIDKKKLKLERYKQELMDEMRLNRTKIIEINKMKRGLKKF